MCLNSCLAFDYEARRRNFARLCHRVCKTTECAPRLCDRLTLASYPAADGAMAHPIRPLVAVLGGSKVSSKIDIIRTLLRKCDKVILG